MSQQNPATQESGEDVGREAGAGAKRPARSSLTDEPYSPSSTEAQIAALTANVSALQAQTSRLSGLFEQFAPALGALPEALGTLQTTATAIAAAPAAAPPAPQPAEQVKPDLTKAVKDIVHGAVKASVNRLRSIYGAEQAHKKATKALNAIDMDSMTAPLPDSLPNELVIPPRKISTVSTLPKDEFAGLQDQLNTLVRKYQFDIVDLHVQAKEHTIAKLQEAQTKAEDAMIQEIQDLFTDTTLTDPEKDKELRAARMLFGLEKGEALRSFETERRKRELDARANAERLEKAKLDALQRADSRGETLASTVRHIVKEELAVDNEGDDDDMADAADEAEAEKARLLAENRKEEAIAARLKKKSDSSKNGNRPRKSGGSGKANQHKTRGEKAGGAGPASAKSKRGGGGGGR